MKLLAVATFLLTGSLVFSAAVRAEETATTQPLPWDSKSVIALAHDLFTYTQRATFIADAEFNGGAPGQDDLARLANAAQTYVLTLRSKKGNDLAYTQKWLQPVEWSSASAKGMMKQCTPGYSNSVWAAYNASLVLIEKIEDYYPDHKRPRPDEQ